MELAEPSRIVCSCCWHNSKAQRVPGIVVGEKRRIEIHGCTKCREPCTDRRCQGRPR